MRRLRDRQITLGTTFILCLMAAATGVGCCYAAFGWRTQTVGTKLREIDEIVSSRYVGEIDEQSVGDYAAVGYLTGLGDRWTSYIPADQYQLYSLNTEGQTCGIGVSIVSGENTIRVSEVYDDSPAQQAGICKGDYIIGAEGLSVAQDGVTAVTAAIQGEEGEPVTIEVQPDGTDAVKLLTMTRAVVTQRMAYGEMLDEKIGYLRINNFRVGASEQFQAALDALVSDGAQSLIIDVRHNGGGRVKEMSAMLDLLLPEGTIMTLTTKTGQDTVYSSDADMLDLPVVVLIDDQSISAAEFFAAALQEYDRATLVGTHTTGKGRAQQTFRLSDGSAINLSTEEYFTPKGKNLAGEGIAPDEEIVLSETQEENFYFLTVEDDPQLQKAVEILT